MPIHIYVGHGAIATTATAKLTVIRYNPAGLYATGDLAMANLRTTGMALATAAALLFGSVAATTVQAADAKVKCQGGNACKGKSDCATATTSCQGQNKCKGTGYVMLTKDECEAAKKANAPAAEKKS
jgi:hypothetical protein